MKERAGLKEKDGFKKSRIGLKKKAGFKRKRQEIKENKENEGVKRDGRV